MQVAAVATITIKFRDPRAVARFWMTLLGYVVGPNHSDSILTVDPTGRGPALLFQPSDGLAAGGAVAIHLDLRPSDQAEAVRLALECGGQRAEIGQKSDGSWEVMTDPEGNLFCILQSARDHDALVQANPGSMSRVEGPAATS